MNKGVSALEPIDPFSSINPIVRNEQEDLPLTACFCHVCSIVVSSDCMFHSCVNVKELLAHSRHKIWSLSDCNWTRIQSYLVRKRTLNRLAKLVILHRYSPVLQLDKLLIPTDDIQTTGIFLLSWSTTMNK